MLWYEKHNFSPSFQNIIPLWSRTELLIITSCCVCIYMAVSLKSWLMIWYFFLRLSCNGQTVFSHSGCFDSSFCFAYYTFKILRSIKRNTYSLYIADLMLLLSLGLRALFLSWLFLWVGCVLVKGEAYTIGINKVIRAHRVVWLIEEFFFFLRWGRSLRGTWDGLVVRWMRWKNVLSKLTVVRRYVVWEWGNYTIGIWNYSNSYVWKGF